MPLSRKGITYSFIPIKIPQVIETLRVIECDVSLLRTQVADVVVSEAIGYSPDRLIQNNEVRQKSMLYLLDKIHKDVSDLRYTVIEEDEQRKIALKSKVA
jgi:hypothetical protein